MNSFWNRKNRIAGLVLLLLIFCASFTAQAGWEKTSAGMKYKAEGSTVYATGWQKIGKKTYYFNSKGIMLTGWQTINKKVYYFGTNGSRRTGWRRIQSGNKKYRYLFSSKGVLRTGFVTKNNKRYYFAQDGKLQYGYLHINNKVYYANPSSGVLARNQWVSNTYYFQDDCTMAVSKWIYGRWVGTDGKFTGVVNNVGFVTDGSHLYYYNSNHERVTGWLDLNGNRYFLGPAVQTGWFTVSDVKYYADSSGAIQKNSWIGKKYLTGTGAMAVGWVTLGTNRYYFKTDGDYVTGWQSISGKTYLFAENGILQSGKWVTDGGYQYYLGSDGARAMGLTKVGEKYYFLSPSKGGKLRHGWISYAGKRYYAKKKGGYVYHLKWFKIGSRTYYATGDCSIAMGLKVIGGKIYYFASGTGRMQKNKLVTVGGGKYYLNSKGQALQNQWEEIDGKYYWFGSDGKMALNTVVGGYRVGMDGARLDKVSDGWAKINDHTVYYLDGKLATGWQTISGNKYYFNDEGVMQTGMQDIGGVKYYFYPTGVLAVNITIAVGEKEYTTNSEGHITAENTIKIDGSTLGGRIAKYAVQYVGNRYVYGGTSLTNGADCSGFAMTVFANFNIKLLRVADDQMKGPSSAYIAEGYKKAVVVQTSEMQPGDLIFYGSGNYASHVAIYIGDGKIVHASNSQPYPAGGIKISNYDYNTPIRVVRYWS